MRDRWSAGWSLVLVAALAACEDAEPPPSPAPTEEPKPVKGATPALPAEASDLLTDLARWDAATSGGRKHAAEFVDSKLDDFTLERLERFECGDQRHEVAIFTHARTGMEFTLVPVGTFLMGSPEGEEGRDDDETQHKVTLTRPFLISRTEVTQDVWKRVMGTDPSQFNGSDRPVEVISWEEAAGFCTKVGLALPTEAQWEYACRAGTTTRFCFGDDEEQLDDYAWVGSGSDDPTLPVGLKQPNAFGLFDMHGNVFEWCEDTWHADYEGAPVDGSAWVDQASEWRVIRSGAYYTGAIMATSAFRLY